MPSEIVSPRVFVQERAAPPRIEPAPTTVTLFIGSAPLAPAGVRLLHSFADYLRAGGAADDALGESIRAYFRNGGTIAFVLGLQINATAGNSLADALIESGAADEIRFNLLCVPTLSEPATVKRLQSFCAKKGAFLIVDAPKDAKVDDMLRIIDAYRGPDARNAALYFPWVRTDTGDLPPCGFVAGLYARTDVARGVWKAPAGVEAQLRGAIAPTIELDQRDNERLNPEAVNCLRAFEGQGLLIWGARTLAGHDGGDADWRYVPVRRLALLIEQSLAEGLQWVVFEPNDEPLWARIRLTVGAFLHELFRGGAFQGAMAQEAYFVRCDRTTMTQHDIDLGIVNVRVGFAPLRPSEFVVINVTLRAQS